MQSYLQFHILTQAELQGLIWIGAILLIGAASLRVVAPEGFHSLGIVGYGTLAWDLEILV